MNFVVVYLFRKRIALYYNPVLYLVLFQFTFIKYNAKKMHYKQTLTNCYMNNPKVFTGINTLHIRYNAIKGSVLFTQTLNRYNIIVQGVFGNPPRLGSVIFIVPHTRYNVIRKRNKNEKKQFSKVSIYTCYVTGVYHGEDVFLWKR